MSYITVLLLQYLREALMQAIYHRRLEMFRLLLSLGADTNVLSSQVMLL